MLFVIDLHALFVALREVTTEHLCEFWWRFLRCQRDARGGGREKRGLHCVDSLTPAKEEIYNELIACLGV